MTNLNQLEYTHIREQIAKQIATAHFPYNGAGIVVRDATITRDEFWNMQSEQFQNNKLIEAQAAMDVMASIGWQNVIATAFDKYVEEK
jgi:hypothetical protein